MTLKFRHSYHGGAFLQMTARCKECYTSSYVFPFFSLDDHQSTDDGRFGNFSDTYEEYKNMIFRHCYFHTFDRELAKDLLQETFIKTWQYLEGGKKVDNMRAFLFRVATNLVINNVRKKKSVSLEALQEAGFDPGKDDASLNRDWIQEERVRKLLEKVEGPYRAVITMRYVEGLQPAEIAEVLGESANTVSVRIHRGLQQLKIQLDDEK